MVLGPALGADLVDVLAVADGQEENQGVEGQQHQHSLPVVAVLQLFFLYLFVYLVQL